MKNPKLKLKEGINKIDGSIYTGLNNDIVLSIEDTEFPTILANNFTYRLSFYNFLKKNISENIKFTLVSDKMERESFPYKTFFENIKDTDDVNVILASSILTFLFESDLVTNKYEMSESDMDVVPKRKFKLIINGLNLDSSETVKLHYYRQSYEIDRVELSVDIDSSSITMIFSDQPTDFDSSINFGDILLFNSVIDAQDNENTNITLKKSYINELDKSVEFNLRGIFGNVNKIQPFKARATFIDTLNPISEDLAELNIIPNNVNIRENVNYEHFTCRNGFTARFLLNSPSGSLYYPLGSIFSASIIAPNTLLEGSGEGTDSKLKVTYYSVSNPAVEYISEFYRFSSIFKKQADSVIYSDFKDGRWDLFIKTTDNPLISKMSIQLFSNDNVELSEKYYINLYQKCKKPCEVLFFLNDLGGISSFDRIESITKNDKLENNIYVNGSLLGEKNPFLAFSNYVLEASSELLNKDEWELTTELLHSGYVFKLNNDIFYSEARNSLRDNIKYIILQNSNLYFNSDDVSTRIKFNIYE